MFKLKIIALSGLAGILFCAPSMFAQTPPSKTQLTKFLDQASKSNKQEEAEGSLAVTQAGRNLPLKSFGSMLKADHRVNQEAVESLAALNNITLSNTTMPPSSEKLEHMTGNGFAAALAANEIKDHRKAIQQFQKAEDEFQGNPQIETYIKQTLPVLETHLKEAQLLQQHVQKMQEKTAQT
jgi:predicted outer membrane protein